MRPAVFLDRDGTVIGDPGYLRSPEAVALLPGALEGLCALRDLGFLLILVTNQSGVGRGYFPVTVVNAIHQRLAEILAPAGVSFATIRVCPHLPDAGCACRKPQPGMLLDAAAELGIALDRSFMIGDKESDVGAGHGAGCRCILIGEASVTAAEFRAADLPGAAALVRGHR